MISLLALAQSDDARDEAVEACLAVESDRDRLSCLETVLGADEAEPEAPAAPRAESRGPVRAPESAASTPRTVTIVDVRRNPLGHTRFYTANGQVYLQTSANRGRYPEVPFEAELDEASRESFFLRSPLGGPRVRVSLSD